MRYAPRLLVTGGGVYAAAALGMVGTIIAARIFGPAEFGLYALAIATALFVQELLDVAVAEAGLKFGVRFVTLEDWGRLRQLFRTVLGLKTAGAVAAAVFVAGLAIGAEAVFGESDLTTPMLIAAAIPLVQVPELFAIALMIRGRYEVKGALLAVTAALRLVAILLGAPVGVTRTIIYLVIAHAISLAVTAVVGIRTLNRYPRRSRTPLGSHGRDLWGFIINASIGTALQSLQMWGRPVLLGIVAVPTQVGFLRASQAAEVGAAAASSPVRTILEGEHTHAWEQGRRAQVVRGAVRYTFIASGIAIVVAVPAIVLATRWVPALFGNEYDGAVTTFQFVLAAAAVQFVFSWNKPFAVAIGRPGLRTWIYAAELAVLLPLVLVLGARTGAAGAGVATFAGALVVGAAWACVLWRMYRSHSDPSTPALSATPR